MPVNPDLEGSGRVSPTKLPARCPALILKQNRLSFPARAVFFCPKIPVKLPDKLLRFFFANYAKQRIFPNTSHSRPICCIFLQQTASFSRMGERTFSSFARLNPAWAAKTGDRRRQVPAGCPAGQMTASRTPTPNGPFCRPLSTARLRRPDLFPKSVQPPRTLKTA